jgi:hypothetical protein
MKIVKVIFENPKYNFKVAWGLPKAKCTEEYIRNYFVGKSQSVPSKCGLTVIATAVCVDVEV